MKYFIDFEFLEGDIPVTMFGINIPKSIIKPNNTIHPISVGITCEDGREYYSISKDFNLKEAWNRYDLITKEYNVGFSYEKEYETEKVYWIRENVLKPIWKELYEKENNVSLEGLNEIDLSNVPEWSFKYLKKLIDKYGKTNKEISDEIKEFIYEKENILYNHSSCKVENVGEVKSKIEFYGYYSDYDWVCFCWLFGRMVDLPKGFPMYCIDLKQELDSKVINLPKELFRKLECGICTHNVLEYLEKTGRAYDLDFRLKMLKEKHPNYPEQYNEHNALSDAEWNKKLFYFLESLK